MQFVWDCICKSRLDKIPWEDICYAIIAEGSGRRVPGKVPEAARYTSVARLREIQPGVIALLEKTGKLSGQARSLDTFLAKVYKYEANAKGRRPDRQGRADLQRDLGGAHRDVARGGLGAALGRPDAPAVHPHGAAGLGR